MYFCYYKWIKMFLFIFIQNVFYCDYLHKYMNLLQITTKDIDIKKVRCIFQNSWKDFFESGFEVIALEDGIFPRSIVKNLAFIYVN